jgi:hypothetical protein
MLGYLLIVIYAGLILGFVTSRTAKADREIVILSFVAHVAGAFAIVVYHRYLYRGGDMLNYLELGRALAQIVERDSRYLGDVLKLAFHRENDLRLDLLNLEGSTSGTMCAFMAILVLCLGDNLYVLCLAVSLFAFVGQWALFRAAESKLEAFERRPVLGAFMLLPSVVFWSSGFVKEAFVIGFLGLLCHGVVGVFVRGRLLRSPIEVLVGLVGIAMVKPYTLFPLVGAFGGWVYTARARKQVALSYKLLGIAVAMGGLVVAAKVFPEFGPEQLAATVSRQQRNYTLVGGDSAVAMGNVEEDDPQLHSQLKYLPLALVNSLARPFLFEVRNVSQLLGALEMTAVIVLLVILLRRYGWGALVKTVTTHPPLMFAAIFVFMFSLAVGLSTGNLGTLSRYRVPSMPLYFGLLLALRSRFAEQKRRAASPARPVDGPKTTAPPRPGLARSPLAIRRRR